MRKEIEKLESFSVLKGKKGASVIIALSMIAAILFFTIGIASTMIGVIRNTADSKKALQAEYSAQSGEELANLQLSGLETGEPLDPSVPTSICLKKYSSGTGPDCNTTDDIKLDYTVIGKDKSTPYLDSPFTGYQSVPLRGYGNAGENCTPDSASNSNDACNWNKIYYGESVSIPLYWLEKGTPDVIRDLAYLGVSEFKIRVRPPCADGTSSNPLCTRLPIEHTSGNTLGAVILNWQISADCTAGTCILSPILDASGSIQEDTILTTGSFVSTDFASHRGRDNTVPASLEGVIMDFLKNNGVWASQGLTKASLKMSYVQEATTDGINPLPYLEYQFIYMGGPLAASYKVNIDGFAQGFKFSLNGVQSLNSGMFDFAVQN